MTEPALVLQAGTWEHELEHATSSCATFLTQRVPNWIAIGARIWGLQKESAPVMGAGLPDELMYAARREIEYREEFVRRTFGKLAESNADVPRTQLLDDCARQIAVLVRDGCRDVATDIRHAYEFLYGIDGDCALAAMAIAERRIMEHVSEIVDGRALLPPATGGASA